MRHNKNFNAYWHPNANFQMCCKPYSGVKNNFWKMRSKYPEDIFFNEEKNQYEIRLEVPGLSKEQVSIKASKEFLFINIDERKNEENKPIKLRYSFRQEVDLSKIKAKYNNGLVSIEISLKESEKHDIDLE